MGQDGERLAVCETQIENLNNEMKEVKTDVKSINRTIWMAMGVLLGLNWLIQFLTKH